MHARPPLGADEMSETQFLARLQESTRRYLDSVDAWEAQYQKYYRVRAPGPDSVSADLESLHQAYLNARKDFQQCVPRARRMCRQRGLREPWQAMLHISLGARTPQAGATTAIGRAERALIAECLAALQAASIAPAEPHPPFIATPPRRTGILQRLYDYFF